MTKPAIFISGAAAGIGRATAQRFAARGWFVGIYDIDEGAAQALAQQLGPGQARAGRLDVADAASFENALADFCAASGARLDVLFNNAGIAAVDDFESIPLARHHRVIEVNVRGVVNGFYAALPYLKKTPGARVISMCSASAIYGTPSFAVYSATKFAVRGLTEALDIEWRRHGIRVMDVQPLFVDTPMVRSFETQPQTLSRMGLRLRADDIADTVWQAATRAGWLTHVHWYPGVQSALMHFACKLSPGFLNRLVVKWLSDY